MHDRDDFTQWELGGPSTQLVAEPPNDDTRIPLEEFLGLVYEAVDKTQEGDIQFALEKLRSANLCCSPNLVAYEKGDGCF